jgi:hypothetical protein
MRCRDCGTGDGELHELFCTLERCPYCGGQLASCQCQLDVLELTASERQVYEEYVDDSVEPLKGLVARWEAALEAKGRVPYRAPGPSERLIGACLRGEEAEAKRLLDEGCSASAARESGYTALMAAAFSQSHPVIALLLARGADVKARADDGKTALHYAVRTPRLPKPEVQAECLRALIAAGADVNAIDAGGATPLSEAAWWGGVAGARELIRAGAKTGLRSARGETALDVAKRAGRSDIAALLEGLAHGPS